ncbi:aminopeptidase N [Micrococcoides hystricis]|uniref:Aminopeptidase N n=1 Tax=Micrococcoides hystricis TaxID=1572761 RepID=A0ABV6P8U8_9MICC
MTSPAPTLNLTAAETSVRADLLTVMAYDITIDLTDQSIPTFPVQTTVRFAAEAGQSTFIDAITDSIRSITLNGESLDPATVSDGTRIQLPKLAEDNELIVDADFRYMNTGEGLHRFVDPADGETYLYTQFEVPDARRVFPCFEQPDLKATFRFTVTAPENWVVVSNYPAETTEAGAPGSTVHRFEQTPAISTYITALIAGPYESVHDSLTSSDGRQIPLGVYARASLMPYVDAEEIFTLTKQGFEVFEKHYDWPYPFKKYDQLFVPEFNAGAMENAGAVTILEQYIFRGPVPGSIIERRAITILHELAHMWFGDLVTMKWWDDLWLNESFAEFMSHLAAYENTSYDEAWTTFAAVEKNWAYRQDQLSSTHPIVAEIRDLEDVQVNFDGITYGKGAAVLRQLVAWVGQENFMAAVRSYLKKHAWGNTVLADLLGELEVASGRDLAEWSKSWLETSGVNTLAAECETDAHGVITGFQIRQTATEDYPTLRPHRLGIGLYSVQDGRVSRVQQLEIDVDGELTSVDSLVGQQHPGIILLNDQDLAYAKIRLDEQSLENALAHLSSFDDSLPRAIIWTVLWNAVRDGELNPRVFLEQVAQHLGAETHPSLLSTVLNQSLTVLEQYVPYEQDRATRAWFAQKLYELSTTATPGSDAQLQFFTTFTRAACTPEQAQELHDLYKGCTSLPGLSIDTDLGWKILTALVSNSMAGPDDIDEALAKDDTATGALAAGTARAAIPSQRAKQQAWDTFLSDDVPNARLRAIAAGFHRVFDPELISSFAADYFDRVDSIWKNRSSHEITETLITGGFPRTQLHEATIASANEQIERYRDEAPALARMLAESRDDVVRATAAQKMFH